MPVTLISEKSNKNDCQFTIDLFDFVVYTWDNNSNNFEIKYSNLIKFLIISFSWDNIILYEI